MSCVTLVRHLVEQLVDEPDVVTVSEQKEREGVVYLVSVAPNDVGRVIGKNGRVVAAIRQFVSAVAAKERQRAYVKIVTV